MSFLFSTFPFLLLDSLFPCKKWNDFLEFGQFSRKCFHSTFNFSHFNIMMQTNRNDTRKNSFGGQLSKSNV